MSAPEASQQEHILHVGFNQDSECFCCGSEDSFRVYNCEPFQETICRPFSNGGIGIVELLFKCNVLALVGGGPQPRFPPNKVMMWDDHQGKCVGELSFRSQVRAVRLRRDRVVVALEHKVLVYNFSDFRLLHQIETLANAKGLVAVSTVAESTVLACPGLHLGQVRLELYDRRQTKFINAHNNPLSCLALSLEGRRLATASEKGTLVRVWSTADGQLLQELRRGADTATVYSLALSRACEWLAVSSSKGTVHVFSLSQLVHTTDASVSGGSAGNGSGHGNNSAAGGEEGGDDGSGRANRTSIFSMVRALVPQSALPKYLTSEWSFAQFRLQPEDASAPSVVGFGGEPGVLYVVTTAGSFYKAAFDTDKGGNAVQDAFFKFVHEPGMASPL
uniref:Autophagy-related protein 18a n=1 Tax=Chlamydomonas euryale TaxID=1486919 RepID=A0A7R9YYL0_9CHLO|mmetsp:Transcript_34191/g.101618  ORF Transcript_34191/g.101618 Transcript_34191/m.101618 type:complete len:390 (+) Transcript_34191:301-1470(+)